MLLYFLSKNWFVLAHPQPGMKNSILSIFLHWIIQPFLNKLIELFAYFAQTGFYRTKEKNSNSKWCIHVRIPASAWKIMENVTVDGVRFDQNNAKAGWKMCKTHRTSMMHDLLYQNESSAKRWRFARHCAISHHNTWWHLVQSLNKMSQSIFP